MAGHRDLRRLLDGHDRGTAAALRHDRTQSSSVRDEKIVPGEPAPPAYLLTGAAMPTAVPLVEKAPPGIILPQMPIYTGPLALWPDDRFGNPETGGWVLSTDQCIFRDCRPSADAGWLIWLRRPVKDVALPANGSRCETGWLTETAPSLRSAV